MTTPTGILYSEPWVKPLSTTGQFQAGCTLTFYLTGTDTPADVYEDGDLTTPYSQPIAADSAGRFSPIYLDPATTYKAVLLSAGGSTLETTDPYIPGTPVTAASVGAALYPQTAAEISAGITPTNLQYMPSPLIDPRRYGVTGNGTTDDTAAMQTCLNIAYATGGKIVIPEDFNILIGNGSGAPNTGLSLTFTGTRATNSLTIEGASKTGSVFTLNGTPSSLFTFSGASSANPTEANLVLRDFGIVAPASTSAAGLTLQNLALWELENVRIGPVHGVANGFSPNVSIQSSLEGRFINCEVDSATTTGYLFGQSSGGLQDNNLIQVIGGTANANPQFAFDIGSGSNIRLQNVDIESNGTNDNPATGAIVIRATTVQEIDFGLLTIEGCHVEDSNGWALQTEKCNGLLLAIRDTEILSSQGGQAINVQGAQSVKIENSYSPSAGDTWNITAQQLTLDSVDVAVLIDQGVAAESSTTTITSGSASIACTNKFGPGTAVTFSSTVGTGAGQLVAGTTYYVSQTGLSSSAFQVSATIGGAVITPNASGTPLVASGQTGVTYPFYGAYQTAEGSFSGFQVAPWPVVLTGCTTVPTGNLITHQQGKVVRLLIPTIGATASSSVTTASLAGASSAATGGSTTTLVDTTQSWEVNQWVGFIVYNSTNGTQAVVTSNTATTLTFEAMGTANASGNAYQISALPSKMSPETNVYVPVMDVAGTTSEVGVLEITTQGQLNFLRNFTSWPTSGSKELLPCEPAYSCA